MTRTPRIPLLALAALILALCAAPVLQAGSRHRAASARSSGRARRAPASRGRETRGRERVSRREARYDRRGRVARDESPRSRRPMSRRERLLEARREAELRRREEIARREAIRRAELARLAAIARQRAFDEDMRNETAAFIARDETTGEDPEIRRIAVAALGGHAGSVVVMDPKTGRVYTIVNQEWALRRGFKPCSTVKLVTGLAGLNEKVIDPVQEINVSTGNYQLDLTDSLAFSNNGYFQAVSGRLGFDRMVSYARQLGLGERTGINHPNEYAGAVPLFKTGYAVNHMGSHGDDFEVTPIQLATLVSAIANGGSLLVPHLPRTPEENVKFQPEVRRHLNFPPEVFRSMIPGMIGSINYGTGKRAYDPLQTIAGKTGTCIEDGDWVGLFTSYAPVEDPHLAIVVVSRGSDGRGHFPVSVAGTIYRALDYRFGKRLTAPVAGTMPQTLIPHPKIDPAKAAEINEEEKEVDEESAKEAGVAPATPSGTAAPDAKVKSVLKPVSTRPTDVTTRPVTAPGSSPAPPTKTGKPEEKERPRRVLTTSP